MLYEKELRFLCSIFKKIHLSVAFINPKTAPEKLIDKNLKSIFGEKDIDKLIKELFESVKPFTIYKTEITSKLKYMYWLLPQSTEQTLMLVGPFLSQSLTSSQILEVGERLGISPHRQKLLEEYYSGVPIIDDANSIFFMIETFAEQIWGGANAYSFIETKANSKEQFLPINSPTDDNRDVLLNMQIMEKRYEFENEMMQAVANGQIQRVNLMALNNNLDMFEKRLADPLRNFKNYSIIMNTLLRKAAQNGGVHPVHLNEISSNFAASIEKLSTVKQTQELMAEMFRSYCRLVRKHSLKNYSSAVQKAIIYIHSDLSANLSLSTLAAAQKISAGYLSAVFKKETGQTVTQYITNERMKQAMHLLSTTRLQIQTVAFHCGIMDVQYFSKLFKKHTGKTPKEYREEVK